MKFKTELQVGVDFETPIDEKYITDLMSKGWVVVGNKQISLYRAKLLESLYEKGIAKVIGLGKKGINKFVMLLAQFLEDKGEKVEVKQIQFEIRKQKLGENEIPLGVIKAILVLKNEGE